MPEAQDVRRTDDPLALDEDGLELPAEYGDHDGIVVRTPAFTVEVQVCDGPQSPLGIIRPRHFEVGQNPDLAPNKVSLKKYGEDAEVFAVDV